MTRARSTWSLLALLSALVLPATALSQQRQQGNQQQGNQQQGNQQQGNQQQGNQQQGDEQPQNEAQANQAKQLKIFQLEHITPREFSELLRRYGGQTLTGAQTAGYAGVGAGGYGAAGGGAYAGAAAGAGSATSGGAGQGATAVQQSPSEEVRIAVDDEKGLLFVRGPQKQLEEIGKLIEAFDVPAGEMKKQRFGDTHLIPVPEEHAQRITNVLRELQIQSAVWGVGKSRVLIFRTDSENEEAQRQMEQAQEIISRLTQDAEGESSQGNGSPQTGNADEQNGNNAGQDEDVDA